MHLSGKPLLVIASVLSLAAVAGAFGAAATTQAVATRATATSSQASETPRKNEPFSARIVKGPVISTHTIDLANTAAGQVDVEGPVWDGVNRGFWVWVNTRQGSAHALLIDPTTGQEIQHLTVPNGWLLGHDGVGLWYDTREGEDVYCCRTRTAPDLTAEQKERNQTLPEDLSTRINRNNIRLARAIPEGSVYNLFTNLLDPRASVSVRPVQCLSLDAQTVNVFGYLTNNGLAQGAGYIWFVQWFHFPDTQCIVRLPIQDLRPVQLSEPEHRMPALPSLKDLMQSTGSIDGPVLQTTRSPTWDGQRLWTLTSVRSDDDSQSAGHREPRILDPRGDQGPADQKPRPLQLIMIDVGLSRHADTDERYKKALAFEKENGTLKALPIFEQIFANDPSAVDIRNHVAWALAARPEEPYHNLDRALELVNEALQWQPWNPEMWDTLAEIYWRKGDAKLAEHLEAKAINLNPRKNFYWRQYEKFQAGPATQAAPEPR